MPEVTPANFLCPVCQAPLRLRDRRYVGATFPCPECHAGLTLLALSDGSATIRPADDAKPTAVHRAPREKSPARRLQQPLEAMLGSPHPPTDAWWKSPTTIGWSIALLGSAALAVLVMMTANRSSTLGPAAKAVVSPPLPHTGPVTSTKDATSQVPEWAAQPGDTAENRLSKLGLRLAEYERIHGSYPPASLDQSRVDSHERWSWLALLERGNQTNSAVGTLDASRPWNDPTSERFSRRQVPEFINPSISNVVGGQGYPTAHFAGSGGVGSDGPRLAPEHPRAGLFGEMRPRRRDDVRDGLSQTIAVLGVESQLGSWAEGGLATVRPLTAEPHVRGPDGFGTGSAGEMLVLMADGSVRTVTTATDPRLTRRMMAIADGLPLDLDVPGEPGDRIPQRVPTLAPEGSTPVAQNTKDDPPVSALEASRGGVIVPVIVRPNPGVVLTQRLLRFDQSKPATRRELLYAIEDLFGRPVVWSDEELGPAAKGLSESITLQLEDGTVADLLECILADTGLQYVIEAERIRLLRSKSSSLTP